MASGRLPRVRSLARFALPLLILATFAVEKAGLNPVTRYERLADGAYYFQIAEHVAAGEGLRTSVSLYGQGLREMPTPATIQPLWPLVLGYAGRVLGMDRAAHWVPEALYFASLLLLYLLANRLGAALGARDLVRVRGVTIVDLGTVAIAILGRNGLYSSCTSKAYTEGLGFVLLFACLLTLPTASSRRVALRAVATGALAGLCYLTRSQFVLVPVAMATALLAGSLREPRLRGAWLASLAASIGVVLPWIVYLATSLSSFPPEVLLNFSAYRETEALELVKLSMSYDGIADRVLDFLASFRAAFEPFSTNSYTWSFNWIAYVVPLALAFAAWQLWARRREPISRLAPGFEALPVFATLLVAAVTLLPTHASHMIVGKEWLFSSRHGFPLILAIVVSIPFLSRANRALGLCLTLVALGGAVARPAEPVDFVEAAEEIPSQDALALHAWLDQHARRPIVMAVHGRSLAASSDAVVHVPPCSSSFGVTAYLRELAIDYLVAEPGDRRRCQWLSILNPNDFEFVQAFDSRNRLITVWRLSDVEPEAGFAPE
jgi:hypothetical protein